MMFFREEVIKMLRSKHPEMHDLAITMIEGCKTKTYHDLAIIWANMSLFPNEYTQRSMAIIDSFFLEDILDIDDRDGTSII